MKENVTAEIGDWVTLYSLENNQIEEVELLEPLQGLALKCIGCQEKDEIKYGLDDYIVQYIDKKAALSRNPKLNKEASNTQEFPVVYVYYRLTNTCSIRKHTVKSVTLRTFDIRTGKSLLVNSYYCSDCNKHYINYEALSKLADNNIYPCFQYHFDDTEEVELQPVSKLRIYGYSVKKNNLSLNERRDLLAFLLEHHFMEKHEIIRNLEFFITYQGKKQNNQDAKRKWQEDLIFVSGFILNNEQTIEGSLARPM